MIQTLCIRETDEIPDTVVVWSHELIEDTPLRQVADTLSGQPGYIPGCMMPVAGCYAVAMGVTEEESETWVGVLSLDPAVLCAYDADVNGVLVNMPVSGKHPTGQLGRIVVGLVMAGDRTPKDSLMLADIHQRRLDARADDLCLDAPTVEGLVWPAPD